MVVVPAKIKKKHFPKFRTFTVAEGGEEEVIRVRVPGEGEFLGIVEQTLGSKRFRVRCTDKKLRICRIPGRMKRKLWVRDGYLVIVLPWEIEGDSKGDIVYCYKRTQAAWMRQKGFLKDFEEF